MGRFFMSKQRPAFTERYLEQMPKAVTRPAKITYRYTPVWPCFDVNTQTERDADVIVGIGLRVLLLRRRGAASRA